MSWIFIVGIALCAACKRDFSVFSLSIEEEKDGEVDDEDEDNDEDEDEDEDDDDDDDDNGDVDHVTPRRGSSEKYIAIVCGLNFGCSILLTRAYSKPCCTSLSSIFHLPYISAIPLSTW